MSARLPFSAVLVWLLRIGSEEEKRGEDCFCRMDFMTF